MTPERRRILPAMLRAACIALLLSGAPHLQAQPDVEGLDCLAPPFDAPATESQRRIRVLVAWLQGALAPYDSLARIFEDDPPEFCSAERLFGIQAYYVPETHRIVLRRDLPEPLLRAVAIHELRHVDQMRAGVCPTPEMSMAATARVTLAMEADASAVSLAIAWELRERGDPGIWTALAEWRSHVELARAFEAEMEEGGDLAQATASAFSAWYASDWLPESYYVAACSAYLDRQETTHALPRYGAFDPASLEILCRLPDGRAYPCREPDAD
jgi:hypothetical protein